jgi:hypothetical protein
MEIASCRDQRQDLGGCTALSRSALPFSGRAFADSYSLPMGSLTSAQVGAEGSASTYFLPSSAVVPRRKPACTEAHRRARPLPPSGRACALRAVTLMRAVRAVMADHEGLTEPACSLVRAHAVLVGVGQSPYAFHQSGWTVSAQLDSGPTPDTTVAAPSCSLSPGGGNITENLTTAAPTANAPRRRCPAGRAACSRSDRRWARAPGLRLPRSGSLAWA